MENIKIKSIYVLSFRNIKEQSCIVAGQDVAFSGNNKIGKTNMLNAAYWCLNGVDLANSSNDLLNVPYDRLNDNNEVVVDVVVKLTNGHDIQRQIILKDGSCKQKVYIDGLEQKTLKLADAKIDECLGILNWTINQSKDFNVRRFLTNPLYILIVKESSFRDFIINKIKDKVSATTVFQKCNKTVKQLIEPILVKFGFDVESSSQHLYSLLKTETKNQDNWLIIKKYLTTYHPNDDVALNRANDLLLKYSNAICDLGEQNIAFNRFVISLNKEYHKVCSKLFKGIDFCLLKQGQGDDVWKNTCYPLLSDTKLPLRQGSTSEKIYLSSLFVKTFADTFGMSKLPFFIDEYETFDNKSTKQFKAEIDNQIIVAKVKNDVESIELEVL